MGGGVRVVGPYFSVNVLYCVLGRTCRVRTPTGLRN